LSLRTVSSSPWGRRTTLPPRKSTWTIKASQKEGMTWTLWRQPYHPWVPAGLAWLVSIAGELLSSKNHPWSMLIQKMFVGIAWGLLLDIGQNHVRDLSNTVTVCAIEEQCPGPCSGTVLFTSL